MVRVLNWNGEVTEDIRSPKVGFMGAGKNAIEKSVEEIGEAGVIITAGRRHFSVTVGRDSIERSRGAGTRV